MITKKELLLVICDKLGIDNPEEYYEKMVEKEQGKCQHNFVSDTYGDPLRKGYEICTECGKQRIVRKN